jgi:hypothetical protein
MCARPSVNARFYSTWDDSTPVAIYQILSQNGSYIWTAYPFLIILRTWQRQKQDRQCTFNVTLRRVRESVLPWKRNKYYLFVCLSARVRACGWPCAWACTCACVSVALFIQHSTCMRHIVTSFVAPLAPPYFSTLFHKRHDFREKVIDHKIYVLILSTTFV